MTDINRRNVLQSLVAGAALTDLLPGAGAQAKTPVEHSVKSGERNQGGGAWFIARQKREITERSIVDFWTKPLCEAEHWKHLPPNIARGVLWHEDEARFSPQGAPVAQDQGALEYVESVLKKDQTDWHNDPSQFVAAYDGTKSLSSLLMSLVGKRDIDRLGTRTALLDLNSLSPWLMDPDWAEDIKAFRDCYDRVIGYFHLEQRGFHHWKTSLTQRRINPRYFDRLFWQPASQCDVVIMTSASLLEHDCFLSRRASTDALVGQLLERLGHALLDENVLEHIAPCDPISVTGEERRMPRMLALGSLASDTMYPEIRERDLISQFELVHSSFGKPLPGRLLIGTLVDESSAAIVRTQMSRRHYPLLTIANSNRPRRNALFPENEFIMLWTFDPDSGPWL